MFWTILLSTQLLHAEPTEPSFGKGAIVIEPSDGSFKMRFSPRIQTRYQFNMDLEDPDANIESNFLVRRARFKMDGFAYHPNLQYKIELGLSNRDMSGANEFNRNTPRYILDSIIKWKFHDGFTLIAGQTKLPGNIERVVSSGNLQFIDRSLLNSKFNIDRDVGIQLHHVTKYGGSFITREKVAFSQGEGRNVTEGNLGGYQYTARLEALPFGKFAKKGDYSQGDLERESTVKMMIGATYDLNDNAVKTRSNMGSYMFRSDGSLFETDITTVFVDGVIKYQGLAVTVEYAHRSASDIEATESDGLTKTGQAVEVGQAFNVQGSYLFPNNIEMALRYNTLDFDKMAGQDDTTQYTCGFSKYIVDHKLKYQADFSLTEKETFDSVDFRTGFDLHF